MPGEHTACAEQIFGVEMIPLVGCMLAAFVLLRDFFVGEGSVMPFWVGMPLYLLSIVISFLPGYILGVWIGMLHPKEWRVVSDNVLMPFPHTDPLIYLRRIEYNAEWFYKYILIVPGYGQVERTFDADVYPSRVIVGPDEHPHFEIQRYKFVFWASWLIGIENGNQEERYFHIPEGGYEDLVHKSIPDSKE